MHKTAFSLLLILALALVQNMYGQDREILAELEAMKRQDQLEEWLVLRMSYAVEEPDSRLGFLMQTQAATWRQPQNKTERETWLNLLLNQGYYLLYNGNIIGSIKAYEDAHNFYKKYPEASVDIAEFLFKPLGNNYTRLGDYASAVFIQKTGLDHALKNHDTQQAASFYNNLAISYRWLGHMEDAEAAARNGLKLALPGSSLYGLLCSSLADIFFERGAIQKAQKNIAIALQLLRSEARASAEFYWLLSAETLAGNIAVAAGDMRDALMHYQRGLTIIQEKFSGARNREKANLLNKFGEIFLEKSDSKRALAYFDQALETLIPAWNRQKERLPDRQQLFPENRLYEALEGKGRALLLTKKPVEALRSMRLALEVANRLHGSISSEQDKIKLQGGYKRLIENAMDICYRLWTTQKDPAYARLMLDLTEQAKAKTLFDDIQKNTRQLMATSGDSLLRQRTRLQMAIAHYEGEMIAGHNSESNLRNKNQAAYDLATLEKQIAQKYPAWNARLISTKLSVEQLLAGIPANWTICNYFLGETSGYNIIATRGRVLEIKQLDQVAIMKDSIRDFVNRYYRSGPAAMLNDPEVFFQTSQRLAKYLHADQHVAANHQLLMIPDDILSYLAFEALVGDGDYSEDISRWPFLIRRAQVSYAFSLNTWLLPPKTESQSRFSGFFLTNAGDRTVEIPAAKLEEKYLSHLIRGRFFQNDKAKLDPLKKAMEESSVLHITTHSFPYGEDAVPTLQLADGNYFLFELNVHKKAPELVVLSACRTADGQLAAGEGAMSLSRGFTAAGANGTVAGLWNVNDAAAAEQMKTFYRFLIKEHDPARALYLMKNEWLDQDHTNPALLLPYYWAGLIYTGKPQKVMLETASGGWSGLLIILISVSIVAIAILIIIYLKRIKGHPGKLSSVSQGL